MRQKAHKQKKAIGRFVVQELKYLKKASGGKLSKQQARALSSRIEKINGLHRVISVRLKERERRIGYGEGYKAGESDGWSDGWSDGYEIGYSDAGGYIWD